MKYAYFIALLAIGISILYLLQDTVKDTYPLYYYSETTDKELNNGEIACDTRAVVSVSRKTNRTPSLKEIIEDLIQGNLTADERIAGLQTEFPNTDFKVLGATINNSKAHLVFTEVPGFTTGGSCRIGLLRAQIEKTALDYPGVDTVEILPVGVLEP